MTQGIQATGFLSLITLAVAYILVLDGSESSFWRSTRAGQALFMGSCEVKPSTDGWHILRAFWKLSSKVRPMAMTCNREHRITEQVELEGTFKDLPVQPL